MDFSTRTSRKSCKSNLMNRTRSWKTWTRNLSKYGPSGDITGAWKARNLANVKCLWTYFIWIASCKPKSNRHSDASDIKYCATELWTSRATTGQIWLLRKRFPYWNASRAPTNRSSNSSKQTFLHLLSLLKECYRPASSKEEASKSPAWIIS